MATADFEVADVATALAPRLRPTALTFNRLEGRPRTEEFSRSLRAEVRDGLWFLTRQWQLAEFEADEAGSPISARLHAEVASFGRVAVPGGAARPYDGAVPLEAEVARRPLVMQAATQPMSADIRQLAGRRWLTMVAAVGDYTNDFIAAYPFTAPNPDDPLDAGVCAHVDAWQYASVGRLLVTEFARTTGSSRR